MKTVIHLGNERISLSLALPERGMPEIIAFGPEPPLSEVAPFAERARRTNGMDIAVPAAVLLPAGGMGFFGWPALAGHRDGVNFIAQFADWSVRQTGAETVLSAIDGVARLRLTIEIQVFEAGLLSFRAEVSNQAEGVYTLDRLMSASVLVADGPATLTSFDGMWAREMRTTSQPLGRGLWLQESRRGRTSHDRFPGLFVSANGVTVAVHLGWSGNHLLAVDRLDDGRRLVHSGELFEPGEMRLGAGQSYRTPKAYVTAVAGSADLAAARFRRFVSSELVRWPDGCGTPRPVTLNTWEGTYFNQRLDSMKAQAEAAAELGIERFVVDDGWFGKRDDDTSGLGDWFVDTRKYPHGLKPLADHVRSLGMQFGLWVEPEMVNPDSDLYRAHADWVLKDQERPLLLSRHQLVLDLARPEVADYLFGRLTALLLTLPVDYLKWDMNRDLTHTGGADGSAATSRQTRAVYALIDKLRVAHPEVEIESCASGGGRMDFGVLERTHRLWTSDGTDALERLSTQYGALHFFAPEILGAHVSAVPNHQTHRRHSLAFRAVVALACHFGVELDLVAMDAVERAELASWIALHKRLRPLLHGGGFFQHPPRDGRHVWGAQAPDKMVLFIAQAEQMATEQPPPLRLAAQEAVAGRWRIRAMHPSEPDFVTMSEGQRRLLAGECGFDLEALRRHGLPLPMLRPECGIILELERIDEE